MRTALLSRARRLPVAAWLAIAVGIATVHGITFGAGLESPWVFPDEVIYGELARSLADGNWLAIRDAGVTSLAYGVVYPALLAPLYAVGGDLQDVYLAVKVLNAVLMTSAAFPAYLIARRVLGSGPSLLAAVLTILVPSLAHTGTLMTENAFYPLFLWFALALVRCLERPSLRRQLAVAGALLVLALTRFQAVGLLPAVVTAVLLVAAFTAAAARPGAKLAAFATELRPYLPTAVTATATLGTSLGALAALGRTPGALVGPYAYVLDHIDLTALPRALGSHAGQLDLYVGIAPFAALVLISASTLRGRESRATSAFVAATLACTLWLVVVAATFSTIPLDPPRVQERYMFYGAPLLFVCLLVVSRRRDVSRRSLAAAAAAAAALPLALPLDRLLDPIPHTSSLALIPWLLVSSDGARLGIAVVAIVLAAALVTRRRSTLAPAAVALYLVAVGLVVDAAFSARADVRRSGALGADPTWIDRAVGPHADVDLVWAGEAVAGDRGQIAVWLNEFFNRSVGQVWSLAPVEDGLPTGRLLPVRGTGALVDSQTGTQLDARYVVADRFVPLRGDVVARDAASGFTLYRTDGAATLAAPGTCRRQHLWPSQRAACRARSATGA